MVVAAITSDILCFSMFSLDHVPLRVSAPQLSLVWAGTEFGNNLLAAVCEGASKQCLPATGSEPPAVRRCCPSSSHAARRPLQSSLTPQIFHTKCPNKYQEWCSSKPFTVRARKQNNTPCLDNHFWIKINTSSTRWVWLKKLMCSSSPDPAISVTSVLVAAILPSADLSFPSIRGSLCRFQSCSGLGKPNGQPARLDSWQAKKGNGEPSLKMAGCISPKGGPSVCTAHAPLPDVGLQEPSWAQHLVLPKK